MQPNWRLSDEIEKPFREAINHASKRRTRELHALIEQLSQEQLAGAVGLCGFVVAYTAINAVHRRWPTDNGLHVLAEKAAEGENPDQRFGVTEQNVYLFASQCALGFRSYAEVFDGIFTDPHEFFAAPFFITVNVLATFAPKGATIEDFLNTIESAYEGAWLLDLNLLPALMVRARMPQQELGRDRDKCLRSVVTATGALVAALQAEVDAYMEQFVGAGGTGEGSRGTATVTIIRSVSKGRCLSRA